MDLNISYFGTFWTVYISRALVNLDRDPRNFQGYDPDPGNSSMVVSSSPER